VLYLDLFSSPKRCRLLLNLLLASCQPHEPLHLSPPREYLLFNPDHTHAYLISLLQVSLLQHASFISSPASLGLAPLGAAGLLHNTTLPSK